MAAIRDKGGRNCFANVLPIWNRFANVLPIWNRFASILPIWIELVVGGLVVPLTFSQLDGTQHLRQVGAGIGTKLLA